MILFGFLRFLFYFFLAVRMYTVNAVIPIRTNISICHSGRPVVAVAVAVMVAVGVFDWMLVGVVVAIASMVVVMVVSLSAGLVDGRISV
jgi:hypothetical protein